MPLSQALSAAGFCERRPGLFIHLVGGGVRVCEHPRGGWSLTDVVLPTSWQQRTHRTEWQRGLSLVLVYYVVRAALKQGASVYVRARALAAIPIASRRRFLRWLRRRGFRRDRRGLRYVPAPSP